MPTHSSNHSGADEGGNDIAMQPPTHFPADEIREVVIEVKDSVAQQPSLPSPARTVDVTALSSQALRRMSDLIINKKKPDLKRIYTFDIMQEGTNEHACLCKLVSEHFPVLY